MIHVWRGGRAGHLTRGTYIEVVTCPSLERGVTGEVTQAIGDPGIYSIYHTYMKKKPRRMDNSGRAATQIYLQSKVSTNRGEIKMKAKVL